MTSLSATVAIHLALLGRFDAELPDALRRAQAGRSAETLKTARIEYSVAKQVEGSQAPATRFYSWRCAGPDYLNVNHGREDGVVHVDANGDESEITFRGPISALFQSEQVWEHTEDCPEASVWTRSRRDRFGLMDLRTIGLNPGSDYEDLERLRAQLGNPPFKYSERVEGPLVVVTCLDISGWKFEWWIDPQRDWSIVRNATSNPEGKQLGETRFELEVFDGIWFPRKIEFFRMGAGESTPGVTIETICAEFNRADHPLELRKSDIGIEVGTRIAYEETDQKGGYWDGNSILPAETFHNKVSNGELTSGPNRQRVIRRLQAKAALDRIQYSAQSRVGNNSASKPAITESEWERFTREFISVYSLNDEQSQKAIAICNECQALARSYLDRKRSELEALEKEKAVLAKQQNSKDRQVTIDQRLKRLNTPIQEIFEKEHRPRLFRLPTRSQLDKGQVKPQAIGLLAPDAPKAGAK